MGQPARILIVDDEANARMALADLLRESGYLADTAGDAFKALARVAEARPDLILTDLRMPSMDGLELLRRVRRTDLNIPVVLMTAFGSVDTALEAMREGALDCIVKPLDTERLLALIAEAVAPNRSEGAASPINEPSELPDVVTRSPEMHEVARLVRRFAPTQASVFLLGEPQTGRARLARALHLLSRRAQAPFVLLACPPLAERATNPHAVRAETRTAVEQASGGTLYLPDVAELPLVAQSALLDALVDAGPTRAPRLISSGLWDLASAVAAGTFREDLARRLTVLQVRVPALRERPDDLVPLARSVLGPRGPGLSAEVVNRLKRHDWPNNIAELRQILSLAHAKSDSGVIRAEHLSIPARSDRRRPTVPGATLADIERFAILQTWAAHGGSTSRAARVLGVSIRKIQYKLQEYGATRGTAEELLRAAENRAAE